MKIQLTSAVIFLAVSVAHGAGVERRTFTVSVDEKPSGSHQLTIETKDDGSENVTAQADVAVKALIFSYQYAYHGDESWKDGRLLRLSTSTNDNGKKHTVAAKATKDGLAMKADGRDSMVKGAVWPTSYWKLPKERGPSLVLLDADTGKLIDAKLEKVGVDKLSLLGQKIDANHYRLSGGVRADLWFDGDDRLVRQESIEEGRRVVLEMSGLTRN
jgi:hypothetical protein